MRYPALLIAILVAGCTAAGEQTAAFQIENASDSAWSLAVTLSGLDGVRLAGFSVDVPPGDSATTSTNVPDRDDILVSVASGGETLGAKSYLPGTCGDVPFRIVIRASSGVALVGRTC